MDDETLEEGMFTLVGDPNNPSLAESQISDDQEEIEISLSKTKSITSDEDLADVAAEKLQAIGDVITPVRLLVASVAMLLIMSSIFATYYWVIPRDNVDVETVYMQGGGGHVVLLEVHNKGSRSIDTVSVEVLFKEKDGTILNETLFYAEEITSHTSRASNNLELIVQGATVWETYTLEIQLKYQDGKDEWHTEIWEHEVGNWVYETFTDEVTQDFWIW
tara:strand:- start:33 stop:689 length:657 start_codon:yes stop_codon:yes gene_type:complete